MTHSDVTRRVDSWWLAAVPPVVAGLAVLRIAEVGRGLWAVHLAAIAVAGATALVGCRLFRSDRAVVATRVVLGLALAALALPLLGAADPPRRWVALGPVSLYAAPVVLPALLAVLAARKEAVARLACLQLVPIVITLLLAAQPDASQATALLAGTLADARRNDPPRAWVAMAVMAAATAWTWTRLDPLAPVPYVEGVFPLAFGASALAGIAVSASALTFIAGLARRPAWLRGVAAYYAVLYACSLAGLTPAPLIGFGAGPVIGFGLLVAVSRALADGRRHAATGDRPPYLA